MHPRWHIDLKAFLNFPFLEIFFSSHWSAQSPVSHTTPEAWPAPRPLPNLILATGTRKRFLSKSIWHRNRYENTCLLEHDLNIMNYCWLMPNRETNRSCQRKGCFWYRKNWLRLSNTANCLRLVLNLCLPLNGFKYGIRVGLRGLR